MPVEGAIQTRAPAFLADYTSADLLIPQLQREDVAGVVQELCQVLRTADRVADMLPFYLFLSAVPATDAADYLCMLSGLTRLTKQQALVERLLHAPDAQEMLAVLKQVKLRESTLMPG